MFNQDACMLPMGFDDEEEIQLPKKGYWSTGSVPTVFQSTFVIERTEEIHLNSGRKITTEDRKGWKERAKVLATQRKRAAKRRKEEEETREKEHKQWQRGKNRFAADMNKYLEKCRITQGDLYKGVADILLFEKRFQGTERDQKYNYQKYNYLSGASHLLEKLCSELAVWINTILGLSAKITYYPENLLRRYPNARSTNTFGCPSCFTLYTPSLRPTNPYLIDAVLDFAELHLQCVQPEWQLARQQILKHARSTRPTELPLMLCFGPKKYPTRR